MIRLFPVLCLAASFAAIALLGLRLPDLSGAEPLRPTAESAGIATALDLSRPVTPDPISFQPIFGAPASVPVPSPVSEAPKSAPTVTHRLIGTVVHQNLRYAILTGTAGEVVMREGEPLGPGGRIARIAPDRVELIFPEGDITLTLETGPAAPASIPVSDPGPVPPTAPQTVPSPTPYRAMVQSVAMSFDEVQALVATAEANLAQKTTP